VKTAVVNFTGTRPIFRNGMVIRSLFKDSKISKFQKAIDQYTKPALQTWLIGILKFLNFWNFVVYKEVLPKP